MRPHCIFIACLVLFAFCSLARSKYKKDPNKCCFSFSDRNMSVKQVESYHITPTECPTNGIIFITQTQREICADPTDQWVHELMNLVDARTLGQWPMTEMPVSSSKVDTVAKQAIRTTETAPLQRPEETTLVHLKESNDWLDFDTKQTNPNTESAYFCMQP